jgi:hypothetical protein
VRCKIPQYSLLQGHMQCMQYIHIHNYSEINSVARENILFVITLDPQSIQSARFSFQSSEFGPSTPTCKVVLLLPPFCPMGETHSLAGEGVGGTQFRRRDKHSGTVNYNPSLVESYAFYTKSDFYLSICKVCIFHIIPTFCTVLCCVKTK